MVQLRGYWVNYEQKFCALSTASESNEVYFDSTCEIFSRKKLVRSAFFAKFSA